MIGCMSVRDIGKAPGAHLTDRELGDYFIDQINEKPFDDRLANIVNHLVSCSYCKERLDHEKKETILWGREVENMLQGSLK